MATLTLDMPGTILPDVLYTLDEIKRRSGLGTWAMRTARRSGLRVIYKGNRAFVLGRDFIAWLESTDGDKAA